ncbi:class I SAM-dependent methyltransferase [Skermania piniformis]|uniref:class I SAM-dependent methyltransferase n=1 Tax=Skermania pinensis TaxID=39122 RepID=UPI00083767D1|nr:class I SAM-dependent methyltransferase [Skermania piniformis]
MSRTPTARLARRATLRRSARLLGEFRFEQSDPDRFYGALAHDTALLIDDLYRDVTGQTLFGATVLDVGGGPGYYAKEFAELGAGYYAVEPDPTEMHAAGLPPAGAVRGSGMALPIRTDAVDVCFSSNVAEHVPRPWSMAAEMLRVTRPGGLMVLSYTVWLGPFGGHETGPWHYLGGERAARRYRRRHGREPKNRYGRSLFEVRAGDGLRWAAGAVGADLVAAFPRYHPRWAWPVVRVPGLREVATSNLVLVLAPTDARHR